MATDINPLDVIKTLLTNNWNDADTDSITPVIQKIYDRGKEEDLSRNDYVFIYSVEESKSAVGIGNNPTANIDEALRIDIRVYSKTGSDAHARKVKTEVERILHTNRVNPGGDNKFCELRSFGPINDLSDRTRKIYRYVLNVNLLDYNRDMTA